jgi:hypothetical protein
MNHTPASNTTGYRDDRGAAHSRAESLQQRNDALAHENASLRAENARLHAMHPTPAKGRALWVIVLGAIILLVMGAALVLTTRASHETMRSSSPPSVVPTSVPAPPSAAPMPTIVPSSGPMESGPARSSLSTGFPGT